MPQDDQTRALKPRSLPLDMGARTALIAFSDAVEVRQAKGGNLVGVTGYASKAAEQACRIAAVLTLWQDLQAPCVQSREMVWGIKLATFYLSEAQRLSEEAVVSEKIRHAEALRVWLLECWMHPEIVPYEVVQNGPIRGLRTTSSAKSALEVLAVHGWLIRLEEGAMVRGSQRKLAYRIVVPSK